MDVPSRGDKTTISLKALRKDFTNELLSDLARILEVPGIESNNASLSEHIDKALVKIAQLKIVDNVSLVASNSAGDLQKDWEVNEICLNHMQMVADALYYLSEDVKIWNVPQFELLTSLHALLRRSLGFFPSALDELVTPKLLPPTVSANLICSVTNKVLSLVAEITLPAEVRLVGVHEGIANFVSENEFQVKVTLIRAPRELVGNLHQLEKMVPNIPDQAIKEENKSEMDEELDVETLQFHVHIPDNEYDSVMENERHWWWSLTELEFFPHDHQGLPFLEEFQIEYLRKEFDARMINLASSNVANRRIYLQKHHDLDNTDQTLNKSAMDGSSNRNVETAWKAAENSEESDQKVNEDQTRPLKLLLEMCRDTSSRFILSAFRMSMKILVGPTSPFRQSCRIAVARHLSPGLRLCYWSGVPVVTDKTVKNSVEVSRVRSVQPFFEIGTGVDGFVHIHSFPSLPDGYEDQRNELKLNVRNPNVKELVLQSARFLSLPILDLLLKEILVRVNERSDCFVECKMIDWKDCQLSATEPNQIDSTQNESAYWTSYLIRCSINTKEILSISICLITGRLQLESFVTDDNDSRMRTSLWEDWLNRVWKTAARTPTKDGSHPHVVALSHAAEAIVQIVQSLSDHYQKEQTLSSTALTSFQHEFGKPININQHIVEDFMKTKINTHTIHLMKNRPQFRFQFLLSLDTRCQRAFLIVFKCDGKNVAEEIFNIVSIPERIFREEDVHISNGKKRKMDQSEDCVHKKRGKPNSEETSELNFLQSVQDEGQILENADRCKDLVLTDHLIDWCNCRISFETLRSALIGLDVHFEEEYLFRSLSDICYRIRLLDWSNVRCPWKEDRSQQNGNDEASSGLPVGFDGLTGLCIDICQKGCWHVHIQSERFRKQSSKQKSYTEGESSADKLPLDGNLFGSAELTKAGVKIHYEHSHTINAVLSDLVTVAVHQMLLACLKVLGYSIGEEQSISEETLLTIEPLTLSQMTLNFKRKCVSDSERWNVQYKLSWKPRESEFSVSSHSSHHETCGMVLREVDVAPDRSTSENSAGVWKRRMEWKIDDLKCRSPVNLVHCSRNGRTTHPTLIRLRDTVGLHCRIDCSISVPDLYLQQIEELILEGRFQDCLISMLMVSGSLFHLRNLWGSSTRSSKWHFHILPQSTAFGFDFLCRTASDLEYIMLLRFTEEGFAFVRLFDLADVAREKPLYSELTHVEQISMTIQNMLSKFVPKAH